MSLLQPKIIAAVTAIVVVGLLVSLAQEMNRRLQVQREVNKLELEVQKLEKNVIELANLNQYFRTDAYQERLAREKLNYQAPGEKVVLIPENQGSTLSPEAQGPAETKLFSIPERWWRAFFVPEAP